MVGRATTLRVRLESGRELTGRVVGTDPDTDVAVVKLDGDGPFPTAVLGTSADLRVGQQAIVIGCPVDLTAVELVGGPSATVGMISALHRSVRRSTDGGMLFDMVQTDARSPPGGRAAPCWTRPAASSGSPPRSAARRHGGHREPTDNSAGGFGFAIPIDLARSVADQLIADGRVTWVWLGVKGRDLDWVTATSLGVPGGLVVAEVMAGSPAAQAGVAEGDVILSLDGVALTAMDQLVVALRRHQPGDLVRVEVMRGQQPMSIGVVLVQRPVPA